VATKKYLRQFYSQKDTFEESRRIELRVEFRGIKELARISPPISEENFGTCAL